jgi:16S rRNA G966 N2-methylase RsmD
VRGDAARFLRRAEPGSFDLVLCDPPYRLADRLAAELDPLIRRVLAEGGRVVAETSPDRPLAVELPLLTERSYGDTLIRVHSAEADR